MSRITIACFQLQSEPLEEPSDSMDVDEADNDAGAAGAESDENDATFSPPLEDSPNSTTFHHFIKASMKHNLPSHAMSDVFNSALMDLGISDPSLFVNQKKMWSQRIKYVESLNKNHSENTG